MDVLIVGRAMHSPSAVITLLLTGFILTVIFGLFENPIIQYNATGLFIWCLTSLSTLYRSYHDG